MDAEELLRQVLTHMVEDKDALSIDSHITAYSASVEVSASATDTGRLVGKRGETANSLRRIFQIVFGTERRQLMLHIVDERNS